MKKTFLGFITLACLFYGCTKHTSPAPANPEQSVAVVSTFAGTGVAGYKDGPQGTGQLNDPRGVAIDVSGNLYVTDDAYIRKITPQGVVSTFAGDGTLADKDGPANQAEFNYAGGIAIDGSGNLYVSENSNVIRKITPDGMVSTFAGNGTMGETNGPALQAELAHPGQITIDASNNIFFGDGNSTIREISNHGQVTTYAGFVNLQGGFDGYQDGPALSTTFNYPEGMYMDPENNLFIADFGNNVIREVSAQGVASTYAGTGYAGAVNGSRLTVSFNGPLGLTHDRAGNLYLTDSFNNMVRKISPAGLVSTLAGNGRTGFQNGPGLSSSFNSVAGMAIDASGNLYVADFYNHVVRRITTQ